MIEALPQRRVLPLAVFDAFRNVTHLTFGPGRSSNSPGLTYRQV
jgi:hypothetical protein